MMISILIPCTRTIASPTQSRICQCGNRKSNLQVSQKQFFRLRFLTLLFLFCLCHPPHLLPLFSFTLFYSLYLLTVRLFRSHSSSHLIPLSFCLCLFYPLYPSPSSLFRSHSSSPSSSSFSAFAGVWEKSKMGTSSMCFTFVCCLRRPLQRRNMGHTTMLRYFVVCVFVIVCVPYPPYPSLTFCLITLNRDIPL